MNILFICHANVCRSFIAQELLKQLRPELSVFSRGLYADPHYTVPEKVQRFLASRGIVAARHVPTQLSAADMDRADLVLVMEEKQLQQILDSFAQHTDKCYLLLDYAYGQETDLADPIVLEGKAFEKQAVLLQRAVENCAKRI